MEREDQYFIEIKRNEDFLRAIYNVFLATDNPDNSYTSRVASLIENHIKLLKIYSKEVKINKRIPLINLAQYWKNVLLYEFKIVSDINFSEKDFS